MYGGVGTKSKVKIRKTDRSNPSQYQFSCKSKKVWPESYQNVYRLVTTRDNTGNRQELVYNTLVTHSFFSTLSILINKRIWKSNLSPFCWLYMLLDSSRPLN